MPVRPMMGAPMGGPMVPQQQSGGGGGMPMGGMQQQQPMQGMGMQPGMIPQQATQNSAQSNQNTNVQLDPFGAF